MKFPRELLQNILNYLPPPDLLSFFLTCQEMNDFDNNYTWNQQLIKKYQTTSLPQIDQEETAKEFFFAYKKLEKVASVDLFRKYFVYRDAYRVCSSEHEMMTKNLLDRDHYLKIQVAIRQGFLVYMSVNDFSMIKDDIMTYFNESIRDTLLGCFRNNEVIEFGFRKTKKILYIYFDMDNGINISVGISEEKSIQVIKHFYVSNFRVILPANH